MADTIDFKVLTTESRPRVYLLWAALTGIGYTATHYYQNPNINIIWTVISIVGLGYMYKVMPLRVKQMKRIFLSWLVPIIFGIGVSVIAVRTDLLPDLVAYLGTFWLLVSAVAYTLNGYVDPPSKWYYIAAVVNLAAGILVYASDAANEVQYLIAAVVSVWSMLSLWLFRSDL